MFSGNLDMMAPYTAAENSYNRMKWKGTDKYLSARRTPFYISRIEGTLRGYIKKVDNFAEVLILNAGHMVPHDQPEAALLLIRRFIDDRL